MGSEIECLFLFERSEGIFESAKNWFERQTNKGEGVSQAYHDPDFDLA